MAANEDTLHTTLLSDANLNLNLGDEGDVKRAKDNVLELGKSKPSGMPGIQKLQNPNRHLLGDQLIDSNTKLTDAIHDLNKVIQGITLKKESLLYVLHQPSCAESCLSTVPVFDGCRTGKFCGGCNQCVRWGLYFGSGGCLVDTFNFITCHVLFTPWIYDFNRSAHIEQYGRNIDEFWKLASSSMVKIHALLEGGVDPNLCDDEGNTALILAAQTSNVEEVKFILEQGADITIKNKAGLTALAAARLKSIYLKQEEEKGRKEIIGILEIAEGQLPLLGVREPEMRRGLKAAKIHPDDYHQYMQGIIDTYHAEKKE